MGGRETEARPLQRFEHLSTHNTQRIDTEPQQVKTRRMGPLRRAEPSRGEQLQPAGFMSGRRAAGEEGEGYARPTDSAGERPARQREGEFKAAEKGGKRSMNRE